MNGSKAGVIAGLIGLGGGSALMYWFDPSAGKKRRAQARDTTRRVTRRMQKVINTTSHTLHKIGHLELGEAAMALLPPPAKAWIGR